MANTSNALIMKSGGLMESVYKLLDQIRITNAEIVAQIKKNNDTIEQYKAQYEQSIAQLRANNAALTAQLEENEEFVTAIEQLLKEKAGDANV